MKIVMSVARFLFIICLPCLLLTAAIAGAVNSSWLYTHGFEKFNVRQSLADNGYYLTQADMSNIARGFIRYWIRMSNILALRCSSRAYLSPYSIKMNPALPGC